jgi:hypothetical protein
MERKIAMVTMRKITAQVLPLALLMWSMSIPASDEAWEGRIVASTPGGAENRLYFGQMPDATDGYDSRYEVRALLSGDIEAYFPHAEWDVLGEHFWRDIKAPDQMKSWVFEVGTALSGVGVMLKWNPLKLPEGYAVELTDMTTADVIDMTSEGNYYYTDTGPRQFSINTKAPDEADVGDVAEFLKSPSGLDGAWGENNALIHLIWTDNSEGESGFMLERKSPGEQWTLVDMLDANTTSYSDYNVAPPTDEKNSKNNKNNNNKVMYLYRVKAYNSLTESEFSNTKPIK